MLSPHKVCGVTAMLVTFTFRLLIACGGGQGRGSNEAPKVPVENLWGVKGGQHCIRGKWGLVCRFEHGRRRAGQGHTCVE